MMANKEIHFTFPFNIHLWRLNERVQREVTLTNRNTAILIRHASNMGYPGILEWRQDSPYAPILSMFENVPRMRQIIDEHLVSLVHLARDVGMQIIYVIDGWKSAEKYPRWREIQKRVPDPQPWVWPESPNKEWMNEYEADALIPGYRQALEQLNRVIDIAPPLVPGPEDWVVTTLDQAKTLLSEKKIWNVLHTGFDLNDGMMYGEVGMYWFGGWARGFILRDCTTALERHDTIETEGLKNITLTFLEHGPAHNAMGKDIQTSILAEIKRNASRNGT
jgi:hypothetical protein